MFGFHEQPLNVTPGSLLTVNMTTLDTFKADIMDSVH